MILLDTNAFLAMALGGPIHDDARMAIAGSEAPVCVSATTAWEIGLLATRTGRTAQGFPADIRRWFADAVAALRLREIALDSRIALESVLLPGTFHTDPADRFLVATARVHDMLLVTKDRAVLAYAADGHVRAVRC